MEKKTVIIRVLTVSGTILACFPIVATLVTSLVGSIMRKKFLLDYLMPAELGWFFVVGAISLIIVAFLAKAHRRLITVSFAVSEALFVGFSVVAQVSGLASGELAPDVEKTYKIIVLTMLGFHILGMIITDIGAVLLWKDIIGPVFRRKKLG